MDLDPEGYGGEFIQEVLNASPVLAPSEADGETIDKQTAKCLADALSKEGVAVWTNAISSEKLRRWRNDVLASKGWKENGQVERVRTDVVRFVSLVNQDSNGEKDVRSAELDALDFLEHIVYAVTKGITSVLSNDHNAGMSLWRPSQGQIAHYLSSRSAHYTWHYDNEKTCGHWRNWRTLTAILYLNELDWDLERDGGALEVVLPEKSVAKQVKTRTIRPTGGTVVLFDSCRVKHRVCESRRDRLAVTQWFVSPTLGSEDDSAPIGWRLEKGQDAASKKRKFCDDRSEIQKSDVASKEEATTSLMTEGSNERGFSFGFFPTDVK